MKVTIGFALFFSLCATLLAEDILLPAPRQTGGMPVLDAVKHRHSNRDITDRPVDRQTLSDLAWSAYGFNRENMRVVPTALNRQELSLYVFLKDGVYLYDAASNKLLRKVEGDHRTKAGRQDFVYTAPINFIYVADRSKDTGTGAFISAGCAVENVYLLCASRGLACRVRTSIDKDEIRKLLALDENQEPLAGQTIAYANLPGDANRPKPLAKADRSLPRAGIGNRLSSDAVDRFLAAVAEQKMDLHSLMVVKDGQVVCERWFGENAPGKNHVMWSVSKTFTSTAVGFAVAERRFSVDDKVVSFFPDDLPAEISPNLAELRVRDLLTMSVGHDKDPTGSLPSKKDDQSTTWEKRFLAVPIPHKPGTKFVYNSLATYMLSSIIQKTTGETLIDYLRPRLLDPLGIEDVTWDVNGQGVCIGGWGLHVKTEDMAKLGLLLLQKGKWGDRQLLPEAWVEEMTTAKILQNPQVDPATSDSDWLQGYCYQMWRCRHGGFRADGKDGQFIVVLPNENAVVVLTAHLGNMQAELNLVWEHLLPALR